MSEQLRILITGQGAVNDAVELENQLKRTARANVREEPVASKDERGQQQGVGLTLVVLLAPHVVKLLSDIVCKFILESRPEVKIVLTKGGRTIEVQARNVKGLDKLDVYSLEKWLDSSDAPPVLADGQGPSPEGSSSKGSADAGGGRD